MNNVPLFNFPPIEACQEMSNPVTGEVELSDAYTPTQRNQIRLFGRELSAQKLRQTNLMERSTRIIVLRADTLMLKTSLI